MYIIVKISHKLINLTTKKKKQFNKNKYLIVKCIIIK